MIQLTPIECRVLGVLIEKAQTTPGQYPLSLNGLVTGCNQKSNRDPELNLEEDEVLDAIDGLRSKSLVRELMLTGSRVQKFRHVAREGLDLGTSELVIIAELLLRGPQTIGELRGRASRMHPLESTDVVKSLLEHLMQLDEPMVRELPPHSGGGGGRAPRYAQLLCPDLHPISASAMASSPSRVQSPAAPGHADLERRMADLEAEVAELKQVLKALTQALGEPSR